MPGQPRTKLSDLYAGGGPFLGQKRPFAEVFPEIESLLVKIDMVGKAPFASNSCCVFDGTNCLEFFDCPNPRCTRGGIRLGKLMRAMVPLGERIKKWN
jgi:hypothetical protein